MPDSSDYSKRPGRDIGGKLLILGNPGSGKTTTMLDLVTVLIQRAKSIPSNKLSRQRAGTILCPTYSPMRVMLPWLLDNFVDESLVEAIVSAVSVAVLWASIYESSITCARHFALRVALYDAKLIPWNYAQFLNYCTERLLLQRVGGRYRFIHNLVQEHFAAMPLDRHFP